LREKEGVREREREGGEIKDFFFYFKKINK
jgi:hypothetical protein